MATSGEASGVQNNAQFDPNYQRDDKVFNEFYTDVSRRIIPVPLQQDLCKITLVSQVKGASV